jgi:hypothetical protein
MGTLWFKVCKEGKDFDTVHVIISHVNENLYTHKKQIYYWIGRQKQIDCIYFILNFEIGYNILQILHISL